MLRVNEACNHMVFLKVRCLEKPVLVCLIKSEFKRGAVRDIGMFDTRCGKLRELH